MLHQDQRCSLVINPQPLKQVIDWLLAPAVFASLRGRRQATWKPRRLAAAALLWAMSEASTLQAGPQGHPESVSLAAGPGRE